MLPNSVTSEETGKYKIILIKNMSVSHVLLLLLHGRKNLLFTYHTQEKSPCGTYLSKEIEALAAAVDSAADEKILGFKGLELSP